MRPPKNEKSEFERRPKFLIQRRVNARVDQLRPHRWNWYALIRPLDQRLARQAPESLSFEGLGNLRFFWLDGLFASISENFYLGYITLFALAYGASNREVGTVTAVANLLGALALFPGARLVELVGRRKPVVVWSAGGVGRLALLALALIPFFFNEPTSAIFAIIVLNGLRSFMGNLANPGWTALVADLVPEPMRGRFFSSRNMAMGLAALLITPLAGQIISEVNSALDALFAGYQVVLLFAFLTGLVSTYFFQRINEPATTESRQASHHPGDLRRAISHSPGFLGLVISAFVWNMALQVAAPFFNVYLVNAFQASPATIGILASVASLFGLVGQRVFGPMLDRKSSIFVLILTGLLIPLAPLAWMLITAPWQVGFINVFAGFLWAGYNLANFNLLLELTPDEQRPRAVALYQAAVFGSAVLGPLLGGFLADEIGFKLIFGLSFIGRYLGMFLFLWLTLRPLRRLSADFHTFRW